VRLKEFDVARRGNLSVQQVIEGLKQLQEYGILSYLPQNDQPQVTYLKPRQHPNNLYINKQYLEQRKATYLNKMRAVSAYCTHSQCRSQLLLTYFDEPNSDKCGICDVCLEEKRKQNATDVLDDITTEIAQLLTTAPLELDDLITSIKSGIEKERLEAIRMLLDAGKIKFNGEKYYL
jgi:ATP-dependent DNA helicase RecQ